MGYTVNTDRGEVGITLDGTLYPMRASYEAQIAIEQAVGTSIEELWLRCKQLSDAASGGKFAAVKPGSGLRLREMAVVIVECVAAAGRDRGEKMLQGWTAERVAELVSKRRFAYNAPVGEILTAALFGGADQKKDEEAAGPVAESLPAAS